MDRAGERVARPGGENRWSLPRRLPPDLVLAGDFRTPRRGAGAPGRRRPRARSRPTDRSAVIALSAKSLTEWLVSPGWASAWSGPTGVNRPAGALTGRAKVHGTKNPDLMAIRGLEPVFVVASAERTASWTSSAWAGGLARRTSRHRRRGPWPSCATLPPPSATCPGGGHDADLVAVSGATAPAGPPGPLRLRGRDPGWLSAGSADHCRLQGRAGAGRPGHPLPGAGLGDEWPASAACCSSEPSSSAAPTSGGWPPPARRGPEGPELDLTAAPSPGAAPRIPAAPCRLPGLLGGAA
jgi:hypothetical protein